MKQFPELNQVGAVPPEDALNPRLWAARVLVQVYAEGRSLSVALAPALSQVQQQDRGLLQELCYGTLRWHIQLDYLLGRLLRRPLRAQEQEVRALLLLGLYQLLHLRIPGYAVVTRTVNAVHALDKPWAPGLVNAVLRNFQRQSAALLSDLERHDARHAHPAWLLARLKTDWPQNWQSLAAVNNSRPPLSLRVNLVRLSRSEYLQHLATAGIEAAPVPGAAAAVTLAETGDVQQLPGFKQGWVSVQDPAAQLAAELLDLHSGQRVLDACAAPGGKTCHIAESEPRLTRLLALDVDAQRLDRVRENLHRLNLDAALTVGDALQPQVWWDGQPYDRILLDAPCSATGVIRRHPDIKVLRRAADIEDLARRQYALLSRLWPLLAPGGCCCTLPARS